MLFAISAMDKPGAAALRAETRPAHLAYLDGMVSQMVIAGPLLDAGGQAVGSLLIVEAESQAAVEAMAAADPYAQAGLFETVTIRPYRAVYKDGARAG
ncbi:YciI family protein [Acidisoma sp. 7E03]